MLKRVLLFATVAVLFLLSGCGGTDIIGKNSDIIVHLMRTDGTQVMTTYEVFITKNGDTNLNQNDPEDFASSTNQPSWADAYNASRGATELQVAFTTRSNQTTYFVWVRVPNTGANFETLKLQIDVDGNDGVQRTFDLNINSTQRLTGVRINRNGAVY